MIKVAALVDRYGSDEKGTLITDEDLLVFDGAVSRAVAAETARAEAAEASALSLSKAYTDSETDKVFQYKKDISRPSSYTNKYVVFEAPSYSLSKYYEFYLEVDNWRFFIRVMFASAALNSAQILKVQEIRNSHVYSSGNLVFYADASTRQLLLFLNGNASSVKTIACYDAKSYEPYFLNTLYSGENATALTVDESLLPVNNLSLDKAVLALNNQLDTKSDIYSKVTGYDYTKFPDMTYSGDTPRNGPFDSVKIDEDIDVSDFEGDDSYVNYSFKNDVNNNVWYIKVSGGSAPSIVITTPSPDSETIVLWDGVDILIDKYDFPAVLRYTGAGVYNGHKDGEKYVLAVKNVITLVDCEANDKAITDVELKSKIYTDSEINKVFQYKKILGIPLDPSDKNILFQAPSFSDNVIYEFYVEIDGWRFFVLSMFIFKGVGVALVYKIQELNTNHVLSLTDIKFYFDADTAQILIGITNGSSSVKIVVVFSKKEFESCFHDTVYSGNNAVDVIIDDSLFPATQPAIDKAVTALEAKIVKKSDIYHKADSYSYTPFPNMSASGPPGNGPYAGVKISESINPDDFAGTNSSASFYFKTSSNTTWIVDASGGENKQIKVISPTGSVTMLWDNGEMLLDQFLFPEFLTFSSSASGGGHKEGEKYILAIYTSVIDVDCEANSKAIDDESTRAVQVEDSLNEHFTQLGLALGQEVGRASGVEGSLTDLTTTDKSSLVNAINETNTIFTYARYKKSASMSVSIMAVLVYKHNSYGMTMASFDLVFDNWRYSISAMFLSASSFSVKIVRVEELSKTHSATPTFLVDPELMEVKMAVSGVSSASSTVYFENYALASRLLSKQGNPDIGTVVDVVDMTRAYSADVGVLSALQTDDKTSIVNAINELVSKINNLQS